MKQLDFKSSVLMLTGRDPDMLGLLREVLTEAGFTTKAKLLDGLLRNIRSLEPPTIILYDESAPQIDAERVYKALGNIEGWADVPFMLMSDRVDGARVARCLDRGIEEFIVKPFDPDELAARVRKILRSSLRDGDESTASQQEGFSGDLSYMNLPDLMINLHQNQRSGELVVTMEEGDYIQRYVSGNLVSAEGPNKMAGRKSIYRAIRLFYGRFVFAPTPDDVTEPDAEDFGPLPNLVLNAVQESDEFPLTRNQLPSEPLLVELAAGADQTEVASSVRLLKPLLQSSSKQCTVDEMIFKAPKTDLEAASDILELFQKEIPVLAG